MHADVCVECRCVCGMCIWVRKLGCQKGARISLGLSLGRSKVLFVMGNSQKAKELRVSHLEMTLRVLMGSSGSLPPVSVSHFPQGACVWCDSPRIAVL